MMLLDLQLRMLQGWWTLADAQARTLADAYLDAGQGLTRMWLVATTHKLGYGNQYMTTIPGGMTGTWPLAMPVVLPSGWRLAPFAMAPPAFWLAHVWPYYPPASGQAQPASGAGAVTTSYRSAGGHATAVIATPAPAASTEHAAWLFWPSAGHTVH